MSHELFGNKFMARAQPGWHNLGTVFPKERKITLVEAAFESGIAYDTRLVPVYAETKDGMIPVPDRMAVIREPQNGEKHWQPLDVVGKNYKLVTNLSVAQTFNDLSQIYPVETIGALGNGERMFAALDAGMVDIKGDTIHQYFTLYDEKTGRSATKIYYTPVRTVCNNTLRMGIAQATLTMNVAHTTGNMLRLEKVASIALEMNKRMETVNRLFGVMAVSPFDLDDFKRALLQIYAPPPKPEDLTVIDVSEEFANLEDSKRQHREAAEELFLKWNDEQPKLANTQWGAWNAVVELEDWKPGRGSGQFSSALLGERALVKQLAFDVIRGK